MTIQSSYSDEYSRDCGKIKSSIDVESLNEIKELKNQISELTKALNSKVSLENVNHVTHAYDDYFMNSSSEDVYLVQGNYQHRNIKIKATISGNLKEITLGSNGQTILVF